MRCGTGGEATSRGRRRGQSQGSERHPEMLEPVSGRRGCIKEEGLLLRSALTRPVFFFHKNRYLNFVVNLVRDVMNDSEMRWRAEETEEDKGMRVTLLGFACEDSQSTPLVFELGNQLSSEETFLGAIDKARGFVPDQGT